MIKQIISERLFAALALTALATASSACGVAPEDSVAPESTATETAALGEASCATTTADRTATGNLRPGITTPATYNNPGCFKAYVLDMNSWSGGSTPPPATNDVEMDIGWGDTLPNNATDCANAFVRTVLYHKVGTTWVQQKDVLVHGSWFSVFGTFSCFGLGTSFASDRDLLKNNSYRFAATARLGTTTHALGMGSQPVIK
jgi:hypothetical protein